MAGLSTKQYFWHRAEPAFPSIDWRKNKKLLEGLIDEVGLRRAGAYNIIEAQRMARSARDPLLAPHGFFRRLPHGRPSAAIEFVERFGPLNWPESTEEQPTLVFRTFWLRHLRYIRVLQLWETRDSEEGLRQAFSDLQVDLEDVDRAENTFSDNNPAARHPLLAARPYSEYARPWELQSSSFDEWLNTASSDLLRETAIKIFHTELNLHAINRPARWARMDIDTDEPVSFRLFLSAGTLWDYIWELTGLETTEDNFWRICPSCNTIFYPKRSDQFYCRSEEQVLASKRNYARARRERERLERVLRNGEVVSVTKN